MVKVLAFAAAGGAATYMVGVGAPVGAALGAWLGGGSTMAIVGLTVASFVVALGLELRRG